MIVAVDDINHILVKAGLDFRLHPFCRTGVYGIDQNHSLIGDKENPVMGIILKTIEITGHKLDGACRLILCHRQARRDQQCAQHK